MTKQNRIDPDSPYNWDIVDDKNPFGRLVTIKPSCGKYNRKSNKIELCFHLIFGIFEVDYFMWEIQFGIRQAELLVEISPEGEVELGDQEFIKSFKEKTIISVKEENSRSSEKSVSISSDAKAGIMPDSVTGSIGASHASSSRKGLTKTLEYEGEYVSIRGSYDSHKPAWTFVSQLVDSYLEGEIKKTRFAWIRVNDSPINVTYKIKITDKNIIYIQAPFIKEAKTANQAKVLHILITKKLHLDRTLSEGSAVLSVQKAEAIN